MIISGKELAREVKENIARKVASYKVEYGREPHLCVILVGDDPSSRTYVRSKGKAAAEVGFSHTELLLPSEITEQQLIDKIHELNNDDGIDGILVQLPLPKHIRNAFVLSLARPGRSLCLAVLALAPLLLWLISGRLLLYTAIFWVTVGFAVVGYCAALLLRDL